MTDSGKDRTEKNGAREELEARGPLEPLLQLPRLVAGTLEDIATIARLMRYLPDLARTLQSIDAKVDSLDEEVRRMREAVEGIGGEVVGVRGAVAPLGRLAERLPRRRRGEPPVE